MTADNLQTIKALEQKFDEAMRNVYRSAKSECGYTATRFMQMVQSQGGLSAAKQLLVSVTFPTGLTHLAECQCLHLSMEALVLDEQWADLFTEAEKRIAKRRIA